jgi:serine/threonine protein kinase
MTLERGALLHKRYRIVEILGQGGMGSVYRAVDENLGVDVAVKENLFTTDEYARQFRLEAVILANLRHPNLPRVTDHFVIGDQGQYLVMDYIEGEDLRQRMERMGNITEDDAILMGAAICDALTYLHTRKPPILHRDIKPGNVKITPDGHIFLVDFGLAKVLHGSQATTTGARAMTPGYSPPEQYGTHNSLHCANATVKSHDDWQPPSKRRWGLIRLTAFKTEKISSALCSDPNPKRSVCLGTISFHLRPSRHWKSRSKIPSKRNRCRSPM